MTTRHLYILIFTFILQIGFSQASFTEADLNSFVQVYMSFKTENTRNQEVDKKHFDKYNVSQTRYKEIAKAAVSNQPLALNPEEEKLIAELQKQHTLFVKNNDLILDQLCQKNNLSKLKYSSILDQYKTDIQFQRSLKPYFDSYIKQLK